MVPFKTMQGALYLFIAILTALPAYASTDLDLPVKGVITSGVGWRSDPFGTGRRVFHRGIDIAVPVGTPVQATRKGRVVRAGNDGRGHGKTVIIQHDNGDRTLYGHNSRLLVRHGELVEAGTAIALSGNSGTSTGPHVHFEQLPGGRLLAAKPEPVATTARRPVTARPEVAVATALGKPGEKTENRQAMEKRMDEAVGAILGALTKSRISEHEG